MVADHTHYTVTGELAEGKVQTDPDSTPHPKAGINWLCEVGTEGVKVRHALCHAVKSQCPCGQIQVDAQTRGVVTALGVQRALAHHLGPSIKTLGSIRVGLRCSLQGGFGVTVRQSQSSVGSVGVKDAVLLAEAAGVAWLMLRRERKMLLMDAMRLKAKQTGRRRQSREMENKRSSTRSLRSRIASRTGSKEASRLTTTVGRSPDSKGLHMDSYLLDLRLQILDHLLGLTHLIHVGLIQHLLQELLQTLHRTLQL
ncbi:hypothetical protein INR49_029355 [Caranx melampygus]|nr:hypothetical protein INR49_029355 [Caranx melampygus]